jgi:hypothetical protein
MEFQARGAGFQACRTRPLYSRSGFRQKAAEFPRPQRLGGNVRAALLSDNFHEFSLELGVAGL